MEYIWNLPSNVWNLSGHVLNGTASVISGSAFKPSQQFAMPKPFEFADFAAVYRASPYVKIAGLSGAVAVGLSAYCAHKMDRNQPEKRAVFSTGLQQHFYHTLALLAVPFAKHDKMAGTMFLTGIVLFCGACYGTSALDQQRLQIMAPFGGFAFIVGWLSLIL